MEIKVHSIKTGDKVVPHARTVWADQGLETSVVWQRAQEMGQPFLYVEGFDGEVGAYRLTHKMGWNCDFFKSSDFTPYVPPKQPNEFTCPTCSETLRDTYYCYHCEQFD